MHVTVTHGNVGKVGEYGLGNQMFQIASTIGIALDNGLEYKFAPWFNNVYFENMLPVLTPVKHNVEYTEKSFNYEPIRFERYSGVLDYSIILNGYFQCEKYFEKYRDTIKNTFQFKTKDFNRIQNMLKEIGTTCSISVRRVDYTKLQHIHPLQPDTYWVDAQRVVEAKEKIDTYIVISDDINWCIENRHLFNSEGRKVVFAKDGSQIDDFMMITGCTHNITVNSTFSWWGAWLNSNPDKVVVIPKLWFGPEGPSDGKDIYPENWIKV